jgi:hypothetical protein
MKDIGDRCFSINPKDGGVTKSVSLKKIKRSLAFDVPLKILMCTIAASSWNCWAE